jgi:hypothetical protein
VKHAAAALDRLAPLLAELRALPALIEKSRGIFYSRPRRLFRVARAVLHFHEDPTGLHADLRAVTGDFERFRVETEPERDAFLSVVRRRMGAASDPADASR